MKLLRQGSLFYLLLITVISTVFICFLSFNVSINFTASIPIGLYQKIKSTTIHRGDLVAFCLPRGIARLGKQHGYLSNGICPGHTTPLLKKVIALPGDQVSLSPKWITVNNFHYFAPQQALDHQHQPIYHWARNKVYSSVKNVWVYGSGDPIHSWDSRYFGGVPVKAIRGIYQPLWVLH